MAQDRRASLLNFFVAQRRAAIAAHVVAVIALFLWVFDAVPAQLARAVVATAVAGDLIGVVAGFRGRRSRLGNTIAAHLILAGRAAAVAGHVVPVVALFRALVLRAITAVHLVVARRAAAIAALRVTVVALLTRLLDVVAAHFQAAQ